MKRNYADKFRWIIFYFHAPLQIRLRDRSLKHNILLFKLNIESCMIELIDAIIDKNIGKVRTVSNSSNFYSLIWLLWLECSNIGTHQAFSSFIDNFGGVAILMNLLMLEKNCPLLTSEGLGKLLSYVASSPQDQNKEAIKSQLNLLWIRLK